MPVDMLLANAFHLAYDPVERKIMEPYFPLGTLYIASALREAGHSVALYDGCFQDSLAAFEAALQEHRPRVAGICALNTTRRAAMATGRTARAAGVPVVFGGPDPTSRPEEYLRGGADRPGDVVVMGEGEETVVDLLPRLLARGAQPPPAVHHALDCVPGIAYVDPDGAVVRTGPRPAVQDLDALPYPAWDLVDLDRYRDAWRQRHRYFSMSLITSRGCPYGCNWCAKPVFGRAYRVRSPQSVCAEQAWLKVRFAPDRIRIVDDIFGLNRKWLAEWHQQVLAGDAHVPFECLSRVDLMNPDSLRQLKEAGCRKIFFGAESGSQQVLDAMDKGIEVEETLAAARMTREAGIETHFYIMIGYPGEGPEDIDRTVSMLRECVPDTFSASVAYPLPGTPFYERVKDRLVTDHDWAYSSENLLLFRRDRYSTLFYRWVERLLNKEWAFARRQRGLARPGRGTPKLIAELLLCRAAVGALKLLLPRGLPFSLAPRAATSPAGHED